MKFGEQEQIPGHAIEEEVLGETKIEAREKKIEEGDYFDIEHHFEAVKEFQPFKDPANPVEKPFPCQVKKEIATILGVRDEQLRYYTSAGYPPLDYHRDRKIDSFIELDSGGGDCARVTWDITTKPEDLTGDKIADVIILWEKDGIDPKLDEDKDKWNDKINKTAEDSIKILQRTVADKGGVIRPLTEFEIEESRRMHSENIKAQSVKLEKAEGENDIPRMRLLERQLRHQKRKKAS